MAPLEEDDDLLDCSRIKVETPEEIEIESANANIVDFQIETESAEVKTEPYDVAPEEGMEMIEETEECDMMERLSPSEVIEMELAMATENLDGFLSSDDIAAIQDEILRGVADLQTELEESLLECPLCEKTYKHERFLQRHLKTHRIGGKKSRKRGDTSITHHCVVVGCSATFSTLESLRRHAGSVHDMKSFQCTMCEKRFSTMGDRRKHEEIHNEMPAYSCSECGQDFKLKANMKRHFDVVHLKKKEPCPYCGKEYAKYDALKQHIRVVHTGETPYQCSYCDRKFHRRFCWTLHERTHTGEKPYSCDQCTLTFTSSGDLSKHKKRHLGYKPFSCSECSKSFPIRSDLTKHMKLIHSDEKPHGCDQCEAKFKTSAGLRTHIRCVHTCERNQECKICNKKFKTLSSLSSHMKWHIGDARFKCHLCPRTFIQKKDMERHVQLHTSTANGTRPFVCDLCGKTFTTRSYMLCHRRLHATEGKPCPVCQKLLKSSSMKAHLLTHTGDKPYGCSRCSARFYNKSNLGVHERTHTGEKPYKCQHCDKRFTQPGNRMKHEQVVHSNGEKPFKCNLCEKSFVFAERLTSHEYKMHREKTVKCPKCPRLFRRTGLLKLHLMKHDGNHYLRKIQKPITCKWCIMRFKSERGLKVHIGRKHNGETVKEEIKEEEENEEDQEVKEEEEIKDENEEGSDQVLDQEAIKLEPESDDSAPETSGSRTQVRHASFQCSQCLDSFTLKSDLMEHLNSHVVEDKLPVTTTRKKCGRVEGKNSARESQSSDSVEKDRSQPVKVVDNRRKRLRNDSEDVSSVVKGTGRKRSRNKAVLADGTEKCKDKSVETMCKRQSVEIIDTRKTERNRVSETSSSVEARTEPTPSTSPVIVKIELSDDSVMSCEQGSNSGTMYD